MLSRRTLSGTGAFAAGFLLIVLLGKGVNGYLLWGMHAYAPTGISAWNGVWAMTGFPRASFSW